MQVFSSELSYLLNAKPPFMSWRRSAFNEVNDWALSHESIKNENDFKCPNFEDGVCLCTKVTDCVPTNDLVKQRKFNELKDFEFCGFDKKIPKYCCPLPFSLLGRGKFEEQDEEKNADVEGKN